MAEPAEGQNGGNTGDSELQKKLEKETDRSRKFEAKCTDLEKTLEAFGGKEGLEAMKADLDALKLKLAGNSDEELEAWKNQTETDIRKSVQKDWDADKQRAEKAEARVHQLEVVDVMADKYAGKFLPSAFPFIKEKYFAKYVDKDEQGYLVKDDDGNVRMNGAVRFTPDDLFEEISGANKDLLVEERSTGTEPRGSTASSGKPNKGMPDVSNLPRQEAIEAMRGYVREQASE